MKNKYTNVKLYTDKWNKGECISIFHVSREEKGRKDPSTSSHDKGR